MDPDEQLRKLRAAIRAYLDAEERAQRRPGRSAAERKAARYEMTQQAAELVELFPALDRHLVRGGRLPAAWEVEEVQR